MRVSTIAIAAVAMAGDFSSTKATDLWLYDHDDYDKHKTFKRFNFGTSQRCYSIVDCFNNKASSASWISAPKHTSFVFYDKEECSGTQYVSIGTPSGQMKFARVGLDNMISSFMIWEYGTFATNGIVKICKDDAVLLTVNTTENSTDASTVGGYDTNATIHL